MPNAAKLALLSGFLGWMFDSMDLNLFTLVLVPTIKELTGAAAGVGDGNVRGDFCPG